MKKHYFTALLAVLPFLGFAQPANDNCANATALTVSTTTVFTNPVTGNLQNATASGVPVACTGVADDDVWYTFTASATRLALSTSNVTSTAPGLNAALRIEVYSGSCSGTLVSCYDTYNNINFIDGLTTGTTYYIRVFTNAGATTPMPLVNFTLALATPQAAITVADDQYTVPELVQDIFSAGSGLTISNITWSTGINAAATEPNGIGYFEQNGTAFPFANGLILSSGSAVAAEGPNGNNQFGGSSSSVWPGDAGLTTVLYNASTPTFTTKNATILEFDFVPNQNTFSFSYIFASEEYGTFQCTYGDGMAIFLTDAQYNITSNLAVVPGTIQPVSVKKINNAQYSNGLCTSVNPAYFGEYFEPNTMQGPTNFNGRTVEMVAESPVTPGNSYHLKIVVADWADTALDSAIFLKGGSFTSGPLFDDSIVTFAPQTPYINCEYSPEEPSVFILSQAGSLAVDAAAGYTFSWFATYQDAMTHANPLPAEYAMDGTEQIVYLRVINGDGAFDIVPVTLKAEPYPYLYDSVVHIVCDDDGVNDGQITIDLTMYTEEILGTQDPSTVDLIFYADANDAELGINPISNPESYVMGTGQVFFSAQYNSPGSTCINYGQVSWIINTMPDIAITSGNGSSSICTDGNGQVMQGLLLQSSYSSSETSFLWYHNGEPLPFAMGPTLYVTEAGTYGLEVLFNDMVCTSQMATFTVTASGLATQVGSGYTVNGNQITVNVEDPGNYTYSLALAGPYQESNVLTVPAPGTYSAYVNDANGCGIHIIAGIAVNFVTPPAAAENQTFTEGQTLADLVVEGQNIQWYADAEATQPLPLDTPLEEGVTYYATQTVNGVESETYPITVFSITGIESNSLATLRCYPNPVKDEVTLQHTATIISATLYNTLGQEVLNAQINNTAVTLNMGNLANGVYLMKVTAENSEKTIKIVKE